MALAEVHDNGFRPERTLRVRVEFIRQLRRRRTQLTVLVLLVLPVIIALAFKVSSDTGSTGATPQGGSGRPGAPALVGLATTGATNFTLFTEFASAGFLLVVIVALFCGDTVASEASWSSLRYLLAIPVPRPRLLRQKLIVALSLSFAANLLLPAWAYLVGGVFFGWAPGLSPLGGTFTTGAALQRLLVVVCYVSMQSLLVAALAFLLSVAGRAGAHHRLGRHDARNRARPGLLRCVLRPCLVALPGEGHPELASQARSSRSGGSAGGASDLFHPVPDD